MNNKYARHVFISILLALCISASALGIAYVVDPAGINNKFDFGIHKDPGLYNRTQKFIEMQEIKPNTLMFGGSRVQFLKTTDVQKYTQDQVYNLAFALSTLEEQYYYLKHSIENYEIKTVVIGLNLYPFSSIVRPDESTDFDKEIFKSGFTLIKQLKYYLEVPVITYIKKYFANDYDTPLYFEGGRTLRFQELEIAGRPWNKRNSREYYISIYKNYLKLGQQELDLFRKMIELCKNNDIEIFVYTTAMHDTQFEILSKVGKLDVYYQWKREIAAITPYYDFMYPNQVTNNEENYIDISHLRQEIGYRYFKRMFEEQSQNSPSDFGKYITEDNIDDHILFLKSAIEQTLR